MRYVQLSDGVFQVPVAYPLGLRSGISGVVKSLTDMISQKDSHLHSN